MKSVLIILLSTLLLYGCTISTGVVHRVGPGETLWRISKTYGVDIEDVVDINDIQDPTEIKAGMKLFIPGVKKVKKVTPAGVIQKSRKAGAKKGTYKSRAKAQRLFSWPVKGQVSSRFGNRNGERHDGLDILAPRGTVIRAAESGKVVFVDTSYDKYGHIIILEHAKNYFTVYAHNSKNLVKRGQVVRKGEGIGRVGRTGNATGYHLHFEVRKGKQVLNPLFFLP